MITKQITPELNSQLLKITPSIDNSISYYPCQVLLKSGAVIDNVYIVQEDEYLKVWGIPPELDPGKKSLSIAEIEQIKESPNRLPARFANELYRAGESGMGYYLFKIIFEDEKELTIQSGNALDFLNLPEQFSPQRIIKVIPHDGDRKNYIIGGDYYWCLFTQ